jgi:hypothetical protein
MLGRGGCRTNFKRSTELHGQCCHGRGSRKEEDLERATDLPRSLPKKILVKMVSSGKLKINSESSPHTCKRELKAKQ